MVKLSRRLKTIHDMVPGNEIAADIGADHGKLIISLYEDGIISRGYAVENKKGPYTRLVSALEKAGVTEKIVPLFSDGISDLPDYVHTVIIAGMGGEAVLGILKKNPEKTKNIHTLIVDAHSALMELREEISRMGFAIADEKMVKESGIYYEIIKFIRSDFAFYSFDELKFGPVLSVEKSPEFREKYSGIITDIDNVLSTKKLPEGRIRELTEERNRIEGMLK